MQASLGYLLLTAAAFAHYQNCAYHPYKRQFNQPGLGQQLPGSDFNSIAPNNNDQQQQPQPSVLPSNNVDDFINNLFPTPTANNGNSNVTPLPPSNNSDNDEQEVPAGLNPFPTNSQLNPSFVPSNNGNNEQEAPTGPSTVFPNTLQAPQPSQQQSQEEQSIPSTIFDDLPSFLGISFPGQFNPSATITQQTNSANGNERSDAITATPAEQSDELTGSINYAMPLLPSSSNYMLAMAIIVTFYTIYV
ncbi:hypothetical protein IWW36_002330 [Coemansia brasiliensis]|uniref:Uncharacterized protein n=1 Tax=Coemansia brasiliensis TaxID=2650707 RepID=A0A9W8I9X1_9FUNG|nr:hypothetical protein IWW36_002330 [Coemansia brasiliensis]